MRHSSLTYRPEIDGLRAIAILGVLGFHAGFAFLGGGFVGVDVFFVISGFLITSIIINEREAGSFSLARFYERRVRRILPALYLVILACIPPAIVLMNPEELKDFAQSLIAVPLFISNLLFWHESGYFNTASELKPLLHTWSLAIEEQYYLFFPLLLALLARLPGIWRTALLALIAAASLIAAQWSTVNAPDSGFFLLPMRAWELFAGSLLALHPDFARQWPRLAREFMGFSGLILILGSMLLFSRQTPHPGFATLLPVLGTVMLIAARNAVGGQLPGRFGLPALGLISYSAYLWHVPLFTFARLHLQDAPPPLLGGALAALSLGLAWCSWRFVEQPCRNRQRVATRPLLWGAGAVSLLILGLGGIGQITNGLERSGNLPAAVAASIARAPAFERCFDQTNAHRRDDWLCPLGQAGRPPRFMVVGDSHAYSLAPAFDAAAQNLETAGVLVSLPGCPPLLGIHALRGDQGEKNCHLLNRRIAEYAASQGIATIFLVARWSYYTDGGYTGHEYSYIASQPDARGTPAVSREAFVRGLAETATHYQQAGIRLVIVKQIPQQQQHPQNVYYHLYDPDPARFMSALQSAAITYPMHRELHARTEADFAALTRGGNIEYLNLDPQLCDEKRCPIGNVTTSYYFDRDHLSVQGALRLMPSVQAALGKDRVPATSPTIMTKP